MALEMKYRSGWASEDGSYGYGAIITFGLDDLSPRQLDVYQELENEEQFQYLQAILNGDATTRWEETNE